MDSGQSEQAWRNELLMRIAGLWRGDWSGHVFDGKDGANWIEAAVHGDADDLLQLQIDLARTERAYG